MNTKVWGRQPVRRQRWASCLPVLVAGGLRTLFVSLCHPGPLGPCLRVTRLWVVIASQSLRATLGSVLCCHFSASATLQRNAQPLDNLLLFVGHLDSSLQISLTPLREQRYTHLCAAGEKRISKQLSDKTQNSLGDLGRFGILTHVICIIWWNQMRKFWNAFSWNRELNLRRLIGKKIKKTSYETCWTKEIYPIQLRWMAKIDL